MDQDDSLAVYYKRIQLYEVEKQKLREQNLSSLEWEQQIRLIIDKLQI